MEIVLKRKCNFSIVSVQVDHVQNCSWRDPFDKHSYKCCELNESERSEPQAVAVAMGVVGAVLFSSI